MVAWAMIADAAERGEGIAFDKRCGDLLVSAFVEACILEVGADAGEYLCAGEPAGNGAHCD